MFYACYVAQEDLSLMHSEVTILLQCVGGSKRPAGC